MICRTWNLTKLLFWPLPLFDGVIGRLKIPFIIPSIPPGKKTPVSRFSGMLLWLYPSFVLALLIVFALSAFPLFGQLFVISPHLLLTLFLLLVANLQMPCRCLAV
jgi:hypothetical protein